MILSLRMISSITISWYLIHQHWLQVICALYHVLIILNSFALIHTGSKSILIISRKSKRAILIIQLLSHCQRRGWSIILSKDKVSEWANASHFSVFGEGLLVIYLLNAARIIVDIIQCSWNSIGNAWHVFLVHCHILCNLLCRRVASSECVSNSLEEVLLDVRLGSSWGAIHILIVKLRNLH